MVVWRAFLYALAVFAALGILSLIVALLMKLLYSVLNKNEKKAETENKTEPGIVSQ